MARFRFKLKALERLRDMEEDRAKRHFFQVLGTGRRLEDELEQLMRLREDEKVRFRQPVEGSGGKPLDMDDILRRQRYINVLLQKMGAKQGEINRLRPDIELARDQLREARRRKKVMEKLRERRRREFDLAEARREVREADEIGQVSHAQETLTPLDESPVVLGRAPA